MRKLALMVVLPITVIATNKIDITNDDIEILNNAVTIEEENKIIEQHWPKDVPMPGKGVIIKNQNKLHKSITMSSYQNNEIAAKNAQMMLKKEREFNTTGYVEIDNNFYPDDKVNNISELQLAFDYKPLKLKTKVKKYGFSPYMTTNKNDGWLGVIEIFRDPSIGYCTYSKYSYKQASGTIELEGYMVNHKVNMKPTIATVEGLDSVAYLYSVNWFDDEYEHKLECANKTKAYYKRSYMIELAKEIDNQQGVSWTQKG